MREGYDVPVSGRHLYQIVAIAINWYTGGH